MTRPKRKLLFRNAGKGLLLLSAAVMAFSSPSALASQKDLKPVTETEGASHLAFDWPIISVGTGEYKEGPTGVTVIKFDRKVLAAVDVRGGGPGTVNAAYMDLGYDLAELDTVVFSGGSWYGLEAVTAVATALKDDGIRDGNAFSLVPSIAMSVGSIIFDFGTRRLNEIYPDKKLAQAAFRSLKKGSFPLGAEGAGRFAKSGGFFGCNAFSGQGAAFKQIDDVKIAAFVVANPYGVITDREGNIAACYRNENWPTDVKTADLMKNFPASREKDWSGEKQGSSSKNTTVSLIVTNQKMTPAELKRLAVQVHTSMARGIQPFSTIFDGDVLYAVSTEELEKQVYSSADLGTIASEVMWDALLSSVPEQQQASEPAEKAFLTVKELTKLTGTYKFSQFVSVTFTREGDKLYAQASGDRRAYAITADDKRELLPVSATDFMIPSRYPLTIRFDKKGQVIFNPGHWQQIGIKQ
ncbi:P1 family peptidase [Emcibacter sp.]|uniref:P1 family peptidase n=1 Tax=Emcibacter sp. TaxID=1979954 RepID=UPI003A905743